MARFQEVIEYCCRRYRGALPLDRNRLGFILYLIDWRSAIERQQPVTDIRWTVRDNGPQPDPESARFVLSALVSCPPDFSSIEAVRAPETADHPLIPAEREVVDFVLAVVGSKNDQELQQLVSSTFPVLSQPKNTAPLNLVALAAQYNRDYRFAAR